MRKALPAIVVSAAGLTWLLHSQGIINGQGQASATTTDAAGTTTTTVPQPTQPFQDPNGNGGFDGGPPGQGFGGDDGGGFNGPGGPNTTSPPTTSAPANGKVTQGDLVQTQWGPVQVAAVIDGSKLVDVQVMTYPNERMRSYEINQQALPMLHDEAISAQSARIDVISGATFTWDGYTQSLQSALDKAGFKK